MEIIIFRHGIAVDRTAPNSTSDENRELTSEGISKTRDAALGLKKIAGTPSKIISSPLVRARQTAEIIQPVIAPACSLETNKHLAPGIPLSKICSWLEVQKEKCLLLVGHMPDLAELASLLISNTPSLEIRFKKAAACCISFTGKCKAGTGCLEWLIQPKQLRLCGRTKK
ncbi:MAG: phosphohistidine phosphatase SixA [Chitinivibrionales bacterium]|nr:phosphohistidine phosphatase SixA [Chitinivibrionales bacterium]